MAAINLVTVPVTIEVDKASELHAQFVIASKELAIARRIADQAHEKAQAAHVESKAAQMAVHDAETKRDSIMMAMCAHQDDVGE